MIKKEGNACMDAIDRAWAEYTDVDAKVIEVAATIDTEKSLQAQQMMIDEAAQSLAEGATDQAASVEEMQATINELTDGIKTTAEELETAYTDL